MRASRLIAWLSFGVSFAFGLAFLFFIYLERTSPGPLEYTQGTGSWIINSVYFLLGVTYPFVGALIATRHPRNKIGWLFCSTGLAISIGFFLQLYADYALFNEPGSLPGGDIASWGASLLQPFGLFVSPIFLMLLFPSGRPTSRFWRGLLRSLILVVFLGMLGAALEPGLVPPSEMGVRNPFGASGIVGEIATSLSTAFEIAAGPAFLLALVSISSRFRRSTGTERLQLKWIVYTAAVMTAGFALAWFASLASLSLASDVFFMTGALALVAIPAASGVAILRHRLYEIDVLVNRTLVYGALTAVLGAIYLGSIFLFQQVLAPVPTDSDLAVAGSTLAVAALFRPARSRVQNFIDRRFYRSRYDAAETLDSFSSRLRDQVDLESLGRDLVTVVGATMQPAHASLWLKQAGERG